MWAWTKEAFAAQVTLLVEFASDVAWDPVQCVQKIFPQGTTGSEHLDDVWAHGVIDAVR